MITTRGMWSDCPGEFDHVDDEGMRRYCYKGGSSMQPTQVVDNSVKIPQWLDDKSQAAVSRAWDVGTKPWEGYSGPLVAGQGADSMAGAQMVRDQAGGTGNIMFGLSQAAQQAAGQSGLPQVTAGSIPQTNLQQYMNPWINNVEQSSLGMLDRSRQLSNNQTASAATSRGAFGGSREAIMEAVTNSESARQAGDLSAQLRSQGYDRATGLATTDLNRSLTAQQSNQNAASQSFQNMLAAYGMSGSLAGQGQQANLRDAASLDAFGNQARGIEQAGIDANMKQFLDHRGWDANMMNVINGTLTSVPHGTNSTATTQQQLTNGNPALGAAGGALSGAATGFMVGGPYGAAAGAVIGGVLGYAGSK